MGTEGMKASLVSREVIADSIELVARGHMLRRARAASSAVTRRSRLPPWRSAGSTSPARALRRIDRARAASEAATSPSRTCSRQSARSTQRRIDAAELHARRGARLPGCRRLRRPVHRQHDGMALEFLGLSAGRANASRRPTRDKGGGRGRGPARRAARRREDRRPRSIVTTRRRSRTRSPPSSATGGSTNAVLHLLAIAAEAGVAAR